MPNYDHLSDYSLRERLLFSVGTRVDVKQLLIGHEKLTLKPYRCTAWRLTIGVGRNIQDRGISESEALFMLDNDLADVKQQCKAYPWFRELSDVRQAAIIDLIFNLGPGGFAGFKKFHEAMRLKQYVLAAAELKDSDWFGQTGRRAPRICSMILNNEWPNEN